MTSSCLRHVLGPAHIAAVVPLLLSLALAGCGATPLEEPDPVSLAAGPSGVVRGGQQPIGGALVQLMAPGIPAMAQHRPSSRQRPPAPTAAEVLRCRHIPAPRRTGWYICRCRAGIPVLARTPPWAWRRCWATAPRLSSTHSCCGERTDDRSCRLRSGAVCLASRQAAQRLAHRRPILLG